MIEMISTLVHAKSSVENRANRPIMRSHKMTNGRLIELFNNFTALKRRALKSGDLDISLFLYVFYVVILLLYKLRKRQINC